MAGALTRARSSCGGAAGRGRGGGRLTSAQGARARASNASSLAHGPVAHATSRACRGFTTTTGRPAVAKAPVTRRSRPPVASSTIRVGGGPGDGPQASPLRWHRWERPSAPQRGAGHYRRWAFATSIPTKHVDACGTPVSPAWQIRAQWPQTTVRAWGVQDVTPHAPAPVSMDPGYIGLSRPGTR